MIKPI